MTINNWQDFTDYRKHINGIQGFGTAVETKTNDTCRQIKSDNSALQTYADKCYNVAVSNETYYGRARSLHDEKMRQTFKDSYRIGNNKYFEHMRTGVVPMQVVSGEEVGLDV